ncbi:histidine phosphatase family protein [SAR202 cluster bacterium AC-409-J13_OGT_754m]|nr:histidine phosphatase family protein [SAR202 cluster bacterium AC-409-J13_OGT_754m]
MTKWLIVRHGATDWNQQHRIQGHSNISLNEEGREQARKLRRRLSKVKINAVYTSDLIRASETADILISNSATVVHVFPNLREQTFGKWEGLKSDQIGAYIPALHGEISSKSSSTTPPQGESLLEVRDRLAVAVSYFKKKHRTGCILIVAHGGSIGVLMTLLMDVSISGVGRFKTDNCSLSILNVKDEKVDIELFNDISHLCDANLSCS